MAVSLLLLLSALTAVLGGLLFSLSRGRGGSLAYRNGLSAIYAAESGANWALASLKQGPVENKERTIPLDGREARVRISSVTKKEIHGKERFLPTAWIYRRRRCAS